MSALRSFRDGRFRRVRRIAVVSVLIVVGLMFIGSAQAVHDNGMFELDGNVVHDSQTTPPYDWTSLFGAGGTPLITPDPINGPVLASAFVDDTDAVDTSYFGGGTKIDDQVHNMSCGGPAANDKTSMDYVYASLIQVPANAPDNAGDQVLYFGIEKQAAGNGGDNAFGFWLFQDKNVGCDASVSTTFTGAHTDGDLFIDGTFTNGGGTSDVEVFRWNGNDTTGSLGTTPILSGGVCGTVVGTDDVCGIANDATITAGPWRSSPTMAANTFVEAGIDMTNLLGSGGGCFSSFLADSQSSQDTNSQPKDYASGQFNTCVPPIIDTTATPGGSSDPLGVSNEHDVATISAVGGRPDPTGSISFFLCNPSEVTAGGCESGGTQVGNAVTIAAGSATSDNASGSLTNTVGKYCWRAEYTPDAGGSKFYVAASETNSDSECFTVIKASPQVSTVADPSSVVVGSDASASVSDTATFTDGFQLDGQSASFTLYSDATCSTATSVTGSATISGGSATFTGDASALSPGTYYWGVSYLGDANNNSVSECGGAEGVQNEVLTIGLNAPNVTTVADPSSAVVGSTALGSVSDTATFTDGFMLAGDSVDFTLYSDPSCDPADATSVAGSAEIGQDNTATFTGDASGLPAGTYYWGVSFLGDANNNPVSECGGDEGVQNEVLTIGPATPSASTTLKNAATNATIANGTTLPHGSSVYDTAQIGNTAGQPLTGTLSFRFFHNGDCSGTPASVQTGVAVGGQSAATGALDEGSYGFQAMYVAGDDPNHTDSAWSACEPFNIQGLVDLAVTKTGSPNPVAEGANITWTMVVTNNGPDTDTGVTVSDPLPAGTTFVSVSVAPPATCTGGAIISCNLGTMTVGQSITITLVTTANVGPTITNTVHVVGDKTETNLANNTASASVAVQAKTPPPVKPCIAVSKVTPKQLFVGRKTTLKIHVTQGGKAVKGIHVRIKGAKINIKTTASSSKGVITQTLKMKKAGVLVFTPIASKACNTKRVGVTNVFTPPVTG